MSLIMAWLSVFSLKDMFKLKDNLIITNSVLSLMFYILFVFIINYSLKFIRKKELIYSYPVGLLFSIMLIIGSRFYIYDSLNLEGNFSNILNIVISIIGGSFLFTSFIIILLSKLDVINEWLINIGETKKNINKKEFFIIWIIIFLCWIPIFLITYPGIYAYDVLVQINQVVTNNITTHHPVIHSLYLYFCIAKLGGILESYESGMAIYSLTQMIMMSGIFSYIYYYLAKRSVSFILRVFTIIFFAILPIHSLFSVSTTKDVIFSGLFVLVFIFTIEMLLDIEKFYSSKKLILRYILTTFIMIIFRSNGIHIFVFTIPIIVLFSANKKLFASLISITIIALYIIYSGPIMNAFNIKKGDFREALSTPIQMMARTLKEHSTSIPKEKLDIVYEVMPKNTIELYNSRLSDPVKFKFNTNVFKNDVKKYVKVWWEIGKEYPKSYFNAFISNNFGYWYPDMIYPDEIAIKKNNHTYIEYNMKYNKDMISVKRKSIFPQLEKYCIAIANDTVHQNVPVMSMLFSPGFYLWILILCIDVILYKKKYILIAPICFFIGLFGVLMLSPIVLVRYIYPLIIALPIMLSIILEQDSVWKMESSKKV